MSIRGICLHTFLHSQFPKVLSLILANQSSLITFFPLLKYFKSLSFSSTHTYFKCINENEKQTNEWKKVENPKNNNFQYCICMCKWWVFRKTCDLSAFQSFSLFVLFVNYLNVDIILSISLKSMN